MIPSELQTGIVKRMEDIFKHQAVNKLNIFEQTLPEKKIEDEEEYYPCIIVRLVDGEQESTSDNYEVKIMFIVGFFYDNSDNQGHKEVVGVINKILADIAGEPITNSEFELKFPLKWALHDEDVRPYYFGAVETTWQAPPLQRQDLGEFL